MRELRFDGRLHYEHPKDVDDAWFPANQDGTVVGESSDVRPRFSSRLTSGRSWEHSATSMRVHLLHSSYRSSRWRTAYYVSVLLVLAFICCEVLDLDGSDFPVPSQSPRIKLAESRTPLVTVPVVGSVRPRVENHTPLLKPEDFPVIGYVRMPVTLASPLTLPRAAPDEPAAQS